MHVQLLCRLSYAASDLRGGGLAGRLDGLAAGYDDGCIDMYIIFSTLPSHAI